MSPGDPVHDRLWILDPHRPRYPPNSALNFPALDLYCRDFRTRDLVATFVRSYSSYHWVKDRQL